MKPAFVVPTPAHFPQVLNWVGTPQSDAPTNPDSTGSQVQKKIGRGPTVPEHFALQASPACCMSKVQVVVGLGSQEPKPEQNLHIEPRFSANSSCGMPSQL